MSYQDFLAQHWQKQPLFVTAAFTELEDFISPSELAGFSLEPQVESRLIIEKNAADWSLEKGPLQEDRFNRLPKTHWTLLIQALDHYVPELARLLDQFNFIPQWRIDDIMMSYAVTGGSVGPHYDYYDVFLIQISGQREWQVGQACDDNTPLIPELPVRILKQFDCSQCFKATPGDMLYLPPGVAHHGIALDDDCITLSVGFRAPGYGELLAEYSHFLANQLPENFRFQDPGRSAITTQDHITKNQPAKDHSGTLNDTDINAIQSQLCTLINDRSKLTRWLAEYLSAPKYDDQELLANDIGDEEILECLAEGLEVIRDESSRFIYLAENEENLLYVSGESLTIPDQATNLASLIASKRAFNGRELLNHASTTAARNWLVDLFQAGYLYIHYDDSPD